MLAYIDPGTGYTLVSAGGWLVALLLGVAGGLAFWCKKIFLFIRRHAVLTACFITAAAFFALQMWNPFSAGNTQALGSRSGISAAADRRVVVLGFDGMNPPLVESMLERGLLPNFQALRQRGSYSRIATTNPAQSPVAWSAIATGQNPGKNGVFDFLTRDPKDYSLRLALSDFRGGKPTRPIRSKTFWQYLADRKFETVLLGFPLTFPPDKISGRMLSGMGVPDVLGTEGTFTYFTSETDPGSAEAGGNVVSVRRDRSKKDQTPQRNETLVLRLTGPKVAKAAGDAENATVPMQATILSDKPGTVSVRWQKSEVTLNVGAWSGWQEVSFDIGWMKSLRGIFKFHLVETAPDFKLYVTPINYDPRTPYFDISYPEGYSAEVASSIGLYATAGMPMDTWGLNEKRISDSAFLAQTESIFAERKRMLDWELSRFKKGLLFAYFEEPDIIQHMFWRYGEGDLPSAAESPELRGTIESWYEKMDGVLGDVLAQSQKEDVIIALSDHGMNSFRRAANVNTWLRQNGYLTLKDPGLAAGKGLLADVDWSKTKAYAIGFGAIYLNRRGRESAGIVEAGGEAEALKEELRTKLLGWRDTSGGPAGGSLPVQQPGAGLSGAVLNNVYRRQEIFWGEYAEESPDLYLGFNAGYRASWQTAIGAAPSAAIEDNLKPWSGDHLIDPKLVPGIFFSSRPILKSGGPTLYDVAPSILSLCGFKTEELEQMQLDGISLF